MIRSTIYGKACRWLSVAAILIATIGVHIIHPSVGRHMPESPTAHCSHPTSAAVPPVGGEPAASVAKASPACAESGACPICSLLAAFHASGPQVAVYGTMTDVRPEAPIPYVPHSAQAPAWLPFGARGPPSSSLI
jgi:hypothetical protein